MPGQRPPKDDQLLSERDILNILGDLDLAPGSYWLVMGAALVLHGVRDVTIDVDLAASDELFRHLVETGYEPALSRGGRPKITLTDNVAAYKDWTPSSWTAIGGVQVASLESIIEEKSVLSRPKDLSDIEAIRGHRARRSSAS
ncbi:hypothetical protein [Micromonospora trifolii]|uniref:hypothetical protein n=1 Tax=Micromonospora trifolii TaxID=2911208 RepID=UPI003CE98EF0